MIIVYVIVGGGFSEKVFFVFSKSWWDLFYIYVLGDVIVFGFWFFVFCFVK